MKRLVFIAIPIVVLLLLFIHLQQSISNAEAEHDRLARLAATVRKEAEAALSRTHTAKADNALLVQVLAKANAQDNDKGNTERPSYNTVKQRIEDARALIQKGDLPAAAALLFWLYDIGIPQSGSFTGLKNTWVLDELGKIAKNYAPAKQGLEERCESAQKAMLADAGDAGAASEFTGLSKALGRQDEILTWYDELRSTDPRRQRLAAAAFDVFVDAGRYSDALKGRSYSDQVSTLDAMLSHRQESAVSSDDTQKKSAWLANFGNTAAKYVEVLAGAGELVEAKEMATKLLATDSSAEAKRNIEMHLKKAGHPELLDEINR